MKVNIQNDGPVSIDYQSHDAEVNLTISLLYLCNEDQADWSLLDR